MTVLIRRWEGLRVQGTESGCARTPSVAEDPLTHVDPPTKPGHSTQYVQETSHLMRRDMTPGCDMHLMYSSKRLLSFGKS